jgi:hypothetical protein
MSTKRKHADADGMETVHASRQAQVPGTKPRPTKKPRRNDPLQRPAHASSVNPIKKRIRDVTRQLQSDNLPANVRIESERALAAYEQELADAMAAKLRNKMIEKYHMVRFFGT